MRYVLLGDAESPHLLKWARALSQPALPPSCPLELWVASSRGFAPGFDGLVPPARRLALATRPHAAGGNLAVLAQLPKLARWLKQADAAWIHAHYLTSHGTLALLAKRVFGVPGRLLGSAWGSDILVAPAHSAVVRALTRRVLTACMLCTSDSQVMAARMRTLGAAEVMVFPFGLEALPAPPGPKDEALFFANRGLEPIYAPERVLALFASAAPADARLIIANDGSQREAMGLQAEALGVAGRVQFVGRLDAATQAGWYARARWYVSLPRSDSVAVSVLEAMAYGCLPILSDLPANRELVRHGHNGWLVSADLLPTVADLHGLKGRLDAIARANHAWVGHHGLFAPGVQAFLGRLQALAPEAFGSP